MRLLVRQIIQDPNLFYTKKLNFKNIGIRIRLPNIMKIMIKKL